MTAGFRSAEIREIPTTRRDLEVVSYHRTSHFLWLGPGTVTHYVEVPFLGWTRFPRWLCRILGWK